MDVSEIPGATPLDVCQELRRLAATVPADQAIVEIGVYKGRSLCHLGLGAKEGAGARVWGIDPWDLPGERKTYLEAARGLPNREGFNDPRTKDLAWRHVKALGLVDHVFLLRGFGGDVGASWSGPPVGLMFVDGDHHESVIVREFNAWMRHLPSGAIVAFDDHAPSFPEVVTAVARLHREGKITKPVIKCGRLAVARIL